jgi:putative transposase
MQINQKIVSKTKNNFEWLIVAVSDDEQFIALSDLSSTPPKKPFIKSRDAILELLEEGKVTIETHQFPVQLYLKDSDIPDKWRLKRDDVVRSLGLFLQGSILQKEYLFGDSTSILSGLIKRSDRSKKYIYGAVNRYFAFGGLPNSLLPQYFFCGTNHTLPQKHLILDDGEVCKASKRGRKTRYGEDHRGSTLTDIANIKLIVTKVKNGDKVVVSILYRKFCMAYHCIDIKPKCREAGGIAEEVYGTKMLLPPPHRISQRTFKYQLKKLFSKLYFKRKEKGPVGSERDLKGKPGSAREGLHGPMSRYEIDSTGVDIYLRYPYSNDEQLATGRPVLYLVIDVYSGMIVGMHISFDSPKWHSAGQALFNAMSDKVSFCAKYGIHITHEDWPCADMCRELTFDRGGENTDAHIIALLKGMLGIMAGNFNAFHRGDAKGTVEKSFDTVQKETISFEAGKVVKAPNKDLSHASRNSIYTLEEFTHQMIRNIIHLNNNQTRIDSHNFEMSRDGVEFTSRAIWNWWKENSIKRPAVDISQLRFALLPEGDASVLIKGVCFQGLFYSCDYIVKNDWLDSTRVNGRYRIKIRYSDLSTDFIWWKNEETKELIQMELTTRSEAYANQCWAHVLHRLEIVKHDIANLNERGFAKRVELDWDLAEMDKKIRAQARKRNRSEAKGIQKGMKNHMEVESTLQGHKEQEEIVADIALNQSSNPTKSNDASQVTGDQSTETQDLSDPTTK